MVTLAALRTRNELEENPRTVPLELVYVRLGDGVPVPNDALGVQRRLSVGDREDAEDASPDEDAPRAGHVARHEEAGGAQRHQLQLFAPLQAGHQLAIHHALARVRLLPGQLLTYRFFQNNTAQIMLLIMIK